MNITDLKKYNYNLPNNLIRKIPLLDRDNAKLFVYDTQSDTIYHDIFKNLDKYLPTNSALILNNTIVKPVRLNCKTENGGKVEVFVLLNEWSGEDDIPIMTNKSIKDDEIKKYLLGIDKEIFIYQIDKKYFLKNTFKGNELNLLLSQFGNMPIPHYLEYKDNLQNKNIDNIISDNQLHLDNEYLKHRYNTIFATTGSSVAAPTASLHFTDYVFDKLQNKNINKYFITLDVGRGTFANLKQENFDNNKLHKERFYIPKDTQDILLNPDIIKVIVGTTACRTVETFGKEGQTMGITDIFINNNFQFKFTDILMTNFHLPQTSLMLLVDSLLDYKKSKKNINDLYNIAIDNQYSFYSFGDSMLII